MKIISAAPPSSGGIALAEMVNMLSQYKLADMKGGQQKHLIIEAMRRAYRDRAEYLGDSDFIKIPIKTLTSPGYAKQLVQSIKPDQATSNDELKPVADPTGNGADTTHFSILDKAGNRVAATLSVNYLFGSAFVVPGTGFLLNDEMDDFSAKPGVPNVYGLVGAEANAIAPYKRPLSSMSPTFLENERGISILGTPGGSRIITMVLLGALEFARGGDASAMVDLPRFHHQYLPDVVLYEDGALSEEEQTELNLQGYILKKQDRPYGNMHSIVWDRRTHTVTAASDKRGIGLAVTY
jgi:gamma-glutamyltranspeptidase/glutathione hydrolase